MANFTEESSPAATNEIDFAFIALGASSNRWFREFWRECNFQIGPRQRSQRVIGGAQNTPPRVGRLPRVELF